MRFLADVMLKKAGRWMRMLGYDVEFPEDEDDNEIMKQAEKKGLILLTMDEELHSRAQRAGIRTLLVKKANNVKQVAHIMKKFSLTAENFPSNTRCSSCNGELKKVGKKEVKDKVPDKSYEAYDLFWLCTKCSQVYWEGAHWDRIKRGIEKIEKELKK